MSIASPQTDPTRRRLIEAAARCFADHGIDRVSLEEVAVAAGVHRTTLHRHFPGGRDELVVSVVLSEAETVSGALLDIIDHAPDARTALVEVVTHTVIAGRQNRVIARLATQSATREAIFGPAATRLRETAMEVWARVSRHDDAGASDGTAALAPERVVDHLFRIVVSLVSEPGAILTADDLRAYIRDFVVPALLPA